MELLTENANLQKKIALLESNSPSAAAAVGSSADGSSSTAASEINQHPNQNPWKHELDNAQAMIQELSKALEDRGDVSDVELIKENAKLQQLNETLATKMQTQQEELCKSQTQLQVYQMFVFLILIKRAATFIIQNIVDDETLILETSNKRNVN